MDKHSMCSTDIESKAISGSTVTQLQKYLNLHVEMGPAKGTTKTGSILAGRKNAASPT